ncbi:MFS transporter [Fictibacillus aquaticus]|uniref:MFS transporter n=1 Tax=Fictibacillus aquaticus TaxID=2021314 RepID=A0A235F9E1_9BACL|nr:MFS transporter [Fictibacillus aquaticus]OYD57916.1 MFS transporter [Fictibacillus aquaticus]
MRYKQLKQEGHITRSLILLLVIGGLFAMSTALSNTFVNIYLWRQSGEIMDIAFYNLSIVVAQPVAFVLSGKLAKIVDRVVIIRIGIVIFSMFYVSVLALGTHSADFLLLLGFLLGTGLGFYWLAFNVLTFEVTEPENRDFFNGFLGILTSLSGMLGPFSAGWIITRMDKSHGYQTIFSISLLLFLCGVVISFFLTRRKAEGRYDLAAAFSVRKENKDWKRLLSAHFFQGLREGTFVFIIVIWVFLSGDGELGLGFFGFAQSAVSFAGYYIVSRFLRREWRMKGIFYGGMILFLSPFLLLTPLSFPVLLGYGMLVSIAYPLLLVPYVSVTYDIIGRCRDAGEKRVEYIVVREFFLNGGRITSIVIFLLFLSVMPEGRLPLLLPLLGSGHFLIYFCLKKISLNHFGKCNAAEGPVLELDENADNNK